MCTTIRTKYHSCGHSEYQNTTHCHLVRRLISSAPYLPPSEAAGGSSGSRQPKEVPYLPQGQQQEGLLSQKIRQPPSSNLFGNSRVPPHPETRSRDDHRLLLQTTKWLPDAQPRVPPGLFECTQNVATRPVGGLCRPCQRQQQREQLEQQSRNATPRLEVTTPVAAGTPSPLQQSSPQIQGKKEGRRKLQKKNKNEGPCLQPGPPLTTATSSPSVTVTPKVDDRVSSSSTTPAVLLTVEKSPSRSLTPASMFRRGKLLFICHILQRFVSPSPSQIGAIFSH